MSDYFADRDAAMAKRAAQEALEKRAKKEDVTAPTLFGEHKKKEDVLDRMEESHKEHIEAVRHYLRGCCRAAVNLYGMDDYSVSADDVRKWCSNVGVEPGNWIGSVFRGKNWVRVGDKKSESAGRHGSRILTWRWVDGS